MSASPERAATTTDASPGELLRAPLDWRNIMLLGLVHVAALGGGTLYFVLHGLTWPAAVIGLVLTPLTVFSISAGYHRLFSHRAYQAHPALRFLLLVRAHQFDPTKWVLRFLAVIRLASNLRRTPAAVVIRARERSRLRHTFD